MKKRILALVTNIYARGGIARYNCDFLESLANNQSVEEVIVLSRDNPKILSNQLWPFKVIDCSPSKIHYSLRALTLLLKDNSFDFIFCGHISIMPLAVLLSKMKQLPIWLQIHGVEAWPCQKPNFLIRWATRQAKFS